MMKEDQLKLAERAERRRRVIFWAILIAGIVAIVIGVIGIAVLVIAALLLLPLFIGSVLLGRLLLHRLSDKWPQWRLLRPTLFDPCRLG